MSTILSARTTLLFLAVALLNLFFFRHWNGLGWSVLLGLQLALITFTHRSFFMKKHSQWLYFYTGGVVLCSLVTLVRANSFVQTVAILTGQLLLLLLWNSLQARQPGVHSFAELVMTPLTALLNHLTGLSRFFVQSTNTATASQLPLAGQKLKSLVLGVLISIPILAIIFLLLVSGDPVFQSVVSDFFNFQWNIDQKIGQRLLLNTLCTVLLIPLLQRKLGVPFKPPFRGLANFNLVTEFSVVVFLLTLLLGVFLVVQWPYIFVNVAAETDLSQFGVATYSEYVTRGFGEFQLVSVIIYIVVWLGLLLMRGKANLPATKHLKLLQLVLLAEFGVFLISLFRRVWLYQELHGMTVVRAYGSYFIFLVSLFAITLACRHFFARSVRWVHIELAILLSLVLLLSLVNVEQYLATSHPPTVNNRVDYIYLSRLSSDGEQGWRHSLKYAEDVLTNPELIQAQVVDSDQRREVAYAGAVVEVLQLHHYHLLKEYADPAKINDFYFQSLSRADERYSSRISHYLETEGPNSATAISLQATREKIRKLQNEVAQLTREYPATVEYRYYNFFFPGNNSCTQSECFLSFFEWDDYQLRTVEPDRVEQVLSFNASRYAAYKNLDSVLPLQHLLDLEDAYFVLLNKINQQPESERLVSTDISLYPPFLTEL